MGGYSGYVNNLGLTVTVDATQANAALMGVNKTVSVVEKQAVASARRMSHGFDAIEKSALSVSRGIVGMNQQLGAMSMMGSKLSALGGVLDAIFKPLRMAAYILPGLGLAGVLTLLGTLLLKLIPLPDAITRVFRSQAELTRQNEELTRSIREQVQELDAYYDRLDKIKRSRSLIGLEGSARAAEELRQAREAADVRKSELSALQAQYNREYLQFMRLKDQSPVRSGQKELSPAAIAMANQAAETQKAIEKAEQLYTEARESARNAELELENARAQEIRKIREQRLADEKRHQEDLYRQWWAAAERRWQIESNLQEQRIDLEKAANATLQKLNRQNFEEFDREFTRWKDDRERAVESIVAQNRSLEISMMRDTGDNAGVLAAELADLDALKEKHADNAAAITAIERQKALTIAKYNSDMARQSQDAFERMANSIEGFIQRTFLQARSFADVWKQALGQVTSYFVSAFAKIAAAQIMGTRGAAPATATSNGAARGGLGGVIGSAMLGGNGNGSLMDRIMPAATGNSGGGGGLLGIAGTSGWKEFFGFGKAGGAHLQQEIAGGAGFMGNLSKLGKSNAALMAGGLLGMDGLRRGGLLGMAETTAGGAMIGFKFGGGIGAAIGAAIGFGAGLVRMFIKGAEDKAKEKIRAVYGVDIKDRGILKQIVEMAKSQFGGNLDMAIRHESVAEIVKLYAMSTGQGISKFSRPMTPYSFSQSGGSLTQLASYFNGAPIGSSIDSLRAGAMSGGGGVVIKLDGPSTVKLLQGEAVGAIASNPRTVQASALKASAGNYGRREQAAMQLSPSTLVA